MMKREERERERLLFRRSANAKKTKDTLERLLLFMASRAQKIVKED